MGSDSRPPGSGPDGGEPGGAFERELAPLLRKSALATPDLSAVFGAIEAEVAREHGLHAWLCSRSTPLRLVFALAVLVLPALAMTGLELRPDLAVYPVGRMLVVLAWLLVLLAVGVVLALRPLHRPALPDWATSALIGASLCGLFALCVLPAAHEAHPDSLQPPGVLPLVSHASACLSVGLLLGTLLLCVLVALGRGGARRAWLLSAAAAGLGANLVLQLHCPNTAPWHLVLGHFTVLALLVLGAALIAKFARR